MINPDELARLEEERKFLLDSLRDLERDAKQGILTILIMRIKGRLHAARGRCH